MMSGTHDITADLQQSGGWNLDASQIEKNIISTSKRLSQNFVQELEQPAPIEQNFDDEIEESIIEEEIPEQRHNWEPPTPLITSKTKQKGKMNLFMMQPPKKLIEPIPEKEEMPQFIKREHQFSNIYINDGPQKQSRLSLKKINGDDGLLSAMEDIENFSIRHKEDSRQYEGFEIIDPMDIVE